MGIIASKSPLCHLNTIRPACTTASQIPAKKQAWCDEATVPSCKKSLSSASIGTSSSSLHVDADLRTLMHYRFGEQNTSYERYSQRDLKRDFQVYCHPRWQNALYCGYMIKEGSFFKSWKKRFFILTMTGEVYYFKRSDNKNPIKNRNFNVKNIHFHPTKHKKKSYCICIHRTPKPFYFYSSDKKEYERWLMYLEKVGAKRIDQETGDAQIRGAYGEKASSGKMFSSAANVTSLQQDIEVKDVNQWTNDNVIEWMRKFTFEDQRSYAAVYGKIWRDQKITGRELVAMQEEDLLELGVSRDHASQMMTTIQDLSVNRKFNKNEFILIQKIQKMTSKFGTSSSNQNWLYLAKSLASEEQVKKTYLSPLPVHDQLEQHLETGEADEDGEEDSTSSRFGTSSTSSVPVETINGVAEEVTSPSKSSETKKIPVKLVVTEMSNSAAFKTVRKLLSPIMNSVPNLQHEFGIFHTAIIVGPWYLEWTDSSLVIPRKLYSSMALLTADLDNTTMKELSMDQVSDRLAKVVTKWNINKEYLNYSLRGKRKDQGNCHDFVEDVIKALDITIPTSGAFATFLKKMKEHGQCEMEFTPSAEFREKFELKASSYKFDTHQELDQFVHRLNAVNELALMMDYSQELTLLKSFDRAFWLRHLKHPHMSEYKPMGVDMPGYPMISDSHKCPFRDPTETKSFQVGYS